jgi:hypothetical protein
VNAGLGLLQTLACSDTSIPPPDMIKLCIPGPGYRCIAIAERVTLMRPSKVAGGVPPIDGFLLIFMFLNGQASICFHHLLTTSGENRR